jgi:four helix bundle protein
VATEEERKRPAKSFRDVVAWQKAHDFVLGVYSLTKAFPRLETFGLTAQLRRSAVSVAANIAEGFKKLGKADKVRFLNTAQGSLEECRYYLILCEDLGCAQPGELNAALDEVCRLLESYMGAIRRDQR